MKIRLIAICAALGVLLAMAVPAGAATSVGDDAGVFFGIANVGKTGDCDETGGADNVGGGGIGAPLLNGAKNAKYSINAPGSVTSVNYGTGSLRLCGNLTGPLGIKQVENVPVVGTVPVGASCVSTKGWGGQGRATWGPDPKSPTRTVWISNLGWKVTVGGTFLVNGDVGGSKGKKSDRLDAVVQALSEGAVAGCLFKLATILPPPLGTSGDKAGMNPDPFTVVAVYSITAGEGCDNNPDCVKKPPKK